MRKRKGKRVEDYSLIAITQTAASQGLPEYKVENSTDIDGLIHAGHGIHSPMVPAVLRQLTWVTESAPGIAGGNRLHVWQN